VENEYGNENRNNDDEDDENSIPNTIQEKKTFFENIPAEAILQLYHGCISFTSFSDPFWLHFWLQLFNGSQNI
jgi:hypothetical protein